MINELIKKAILKVGIDYYTGGIREQQLMQFGQTIAKEVAMRFMRLEDGDKKMVTLELIHTIADQIINECENDRTK